MKPLLVISFILLFIWMGIDNTKTASLYIKSTVNLKDTIDFTRQIQPILINHCSPCHFTGGKMYEKLPFDKDMTIINHQAGILRRIKGDNNLLIKAFVQQHR